MNNQLALSLTPVKHQEVDNIAMGILPSGETYLSLTGLSKFCGVSPTLIKDFSQNWSSGKVFGKKRGDKIAELIKEWIESETLPQSLYVEIKSESSISGVIHAVPEQICMAILDYYAHYADEIRKEAVKNYRIAARYGLRKYIYERLDYDETQVLTQSWNLFQERVLSNETPAGYFTMFDQGTQIIASLIKGGIAVDDTIMPDGSLGNHWGRYWRKNALDKKFGSREKIQHKFPDAYRQLDPEVWAYPNEALIEFRNWFESTYIPEKYPTYIKNKIGQGKISRDKADLLIAAVMPPSLEDKRKS